MTPYLLYIGGSLKTGKWGIPTKSPQKPGKQPEGTGLDELYDEKAKIELMIIRNNDSFSRNLALEYCMTMRVPCPPHGTTSIVLG